MFYLPCFIYHISPSFISFLCQLVKIAIHLFIGTIRRVLREIDETQHNYRRRGLVTVRMFFFLVVPKISLWIVHCLVHNNLHFHFIRPSVNLSWTFNAHSFVCFFQVNPRPYHSDCYYDRVHIDQNEKGVQYGSTIVILVRFTVIPLYKVYMWVWVLGFGGGVISVLLEYCIPGIVLYCLCDTIWSVFFQYTIGLSIEVQLG